MQDGGAGNVVKFDVVGHLFGDSRGKSGYLLMYVHEESIGGPSTKLLDGVAVNVVEFHGHGATGSEGM